MSYRTNKRYCDNRLGITNIIFSDSSPADNDCGCNNSGSGGGGIIVPPPNPNLPIQEIELIINSNNQILFTNVIPENRILVGLYVDGYRQTMGLDYEIDERNIQWKPTDAGFILDPTLTLIITVQ